MCLRVSFVCLFLCGGLLSAEERTSAALISVANNPANRHVLIAAHRGGYESDKADEAAENSVANVAVAIRKGYDVYETDIQRTSDGAFVIVHDPTIDRETTGTGRVEDFTLKELKSLRRRYRDGSVSEEKVATLEELLLAGKDRILFKPDLKPGVIEHFDELARLIVRLGMQEQVFLRTWYSDARVIRTLYASGTPRVEVMFKLGSAGQVQEIHRDFEPITVEIKLEKGEALSPEKIDAIQSARGLGILVETHSYGDPEQWEALAIAGVRMFHTNSPAETLRYLKANGWRSGGE